MAGSSPSSPEPPDIDLPFPERVYEIVARIPEGRATTYGAIARALGNPRAAREVGWALRSVPEESHLPCHRVVDREGRLSGGWAFGHPDIMAGRLEEEGVPFLEQYRVDLSACFWDPAAEDDTHQLGLF
jgi:methylated-DNA-protein-cysteine methyltransferase-like protein